MTAPRLYALVVARDAKRQITASVESVAAYRVVVKTRAKDQPEADRDKNAVQRYLESLAHA